MKQKGQGILLQSEICFASLSPRAKKLFYHALCAGHFFCEDNYCVKRDSYDSFLILHVLKGSISFVNKDGEFVSATENETVIIDCYKPHFYCTQDYLESIWVHVAGCNSTSLCESIISEQGNIVRHKDCGKIKNALFNIFNGIDKGKASEAELSIEIYKLILSLAEKSEDEDAVRSIQNYIESHISENITVKNLADTAHMSVTHFSRVFKQKSGFSPYEYVLNVRLNRAKELLLKSDMSIAEIAYETGFNSEANFVYCFKKNEGLSPGKFRKAGF